MSKGLTCNNANEGWSILGPLLNYHLSPFVAICILSKVEVGPIEHLEVDIPGVRYGV